MISPSRQHPLRRHPGAGAAVPVLVFLGIVTLSTLFFFAFTWTRWTGKNMETLGSAPEKPSSTAGAAGKTKPKDNEPTVPKPAPPRAAPIFAKPEMLLDAVAAELREPNLEAAIRTAGKDLAASPQANLVRLLLSKGGFRVPSQGAAWIEAGQLGQAPRHRLRIEPAVPGVPPPAGPLWADLVRDKATGAWRVSRFIVSPPLIAQAVERLRQEGVVIDPASVTTPPDALSRSLDFLDAVMTRDFRTARALSDHASVTQERLAGLCIVVEEGDYQFAAKRPVVVTAASADAAIAIVRVRSEKDKLDAELGLTLHPEGKDKWKVKELDFNRLLESHVKATGAGAVYYSPIVKSPQGGESLVVYFDFDSDKLVPRALAQLEIVSGLLKTDPARKLRITGHSDDIGTDDYNYKLSSGRAKNVREKLHSLGVNPAQIETLGFGATAPLDTNRRDDGTDNPEGRSRNRRTEIYLDF